MIRLSEQMVVIGVDSLKERFSKGVVSLKERKVQRCEFIEGRID